MQSFFTALNFLTRIPIRSSANIDARTMVRSITYFPVVGAILGAITAGVFILLNPLFPRPVVTVFILVTPILLTGGIHFDGLMDTADGLFSGRPRERILEIMRDSRVGSMGILAGLFNIFFRYSLLNELPQQVLPLILIMVPTASRWVMSLALCNFPYARPEGGLGTGFTTGNRKWSLIFSTILGLVIITLITHISGLVITIIVGLICLFLAYRITQKIGGLTGDVYGALSEIAEVLLLILWLAYYISKLN